MWEVTGWKAGAVVRRWRGGFLSGCRRRLVVREELGGKGKISTIEGLGWGDVGNSSRGGANAEENPREMMEPVSRRRTSPESIFGAAMETFN